MKTLNWRKLNSSPPDLDELIQIDLYELDDGGSIIEYFIDYSTDPNETLFYRRTRFSYDEKNSWAVGSFE